MSKLPFNSVLLLATFITNAVPFTTQVGLYSPLFQLMLYLQLQFGLYSPLFQLVLSQLPLNSDFTHHFSTWCCPIYHWIWSFVYSPLELSAVHSPLRWDSPHHFQLVCPYIQLDLSPLAYMPSDQDSVPFY